MKISGIVVASLLAILMVVWISQFLGHPLSRLSNAQSGLEFYPEPGGVVIGYFQAASKPYYSTTQNPNDGTVPRAWENALPKYGHFGFAGAEIHWNATRLWFRGGPTSAVDYIGHDWGFTIPIWLCVTAITVMAIYAFRVRHRRRNAARGFEVIPTDPRR